ncbi:MAG: dUTP diphosphatase [Chitinophagia bacterium]|nr:dUTP diphosphatase [Chitinophagia bacterium]
MPLKVVNRSGHPLPTYATEGASGMDVRACLTEDIVLQPMQRMAVPTGLWIEIPSGFEVQVRPRSGLALKQGITCLNTPGTIDSDYRGELKVILVNLSDQPQAIRHGERIAQLVLQRVGRASWSEATALGASERGEGGFGHTGRE